MPTPSRKINSNFGPRWGRQHEGLDVKVYIGDTIRAAFDGKVRICKYNGGGYGYYIVIRHPNGLETLYGHLSKQIVKKDQVVRAGEPMWFALVNLSDWVATLVSLQVLTSISRPVYLVSLSIQLSCSTLSIRTW